MLKVIINSQNAIIGSVVSDAASIELAGAVALDGSPVNVKQVRLSASKANLSKAAKLDIASAVRREKGGRVFFTLPCDAGV